MAKIKISEQQAKIVRLTLNEKRNRVKVTEKQLNSIKEYELKKEKISDIKIIKSPKGYFLGRTEYNPDLKKEEIYSKDSSIVDSKEGICKLYSKGQYNKEIQETETIFESNSQHEIVGDPKKTCDISEDSIYGSKFNKPSEKVKQHFKKEVKKIPDTKIKVETEELLDEGGLAMTLFEFAQNVIDFLKASMTDSTPVPNKFLADLGVTEGGFKQALLDMGIISYIAYKGKTKYKVHKENLTKKIKKLYSFIKDLKNDNEDDEVKNTYTPPKDDVEEATTTGSVGGYYVQPKIWAKSPENAIHRKKPTYNGGTIVEDDENSDPYFSKMETIIEKMLDVGQGEWFESEFNELVEIGENMGKSKGEVETELDNFVDTYMEDKNMKTESKDSTPFNKKVTFDDCVKLNNNKETQKGGCSQGAVDNVVKVS